VGKPDLDYWQRHLEGAQPFLDLPTDHPRPQVLSCQRGSVPLAMTPELTSALRRLARHRGSTLLAVLLTGWAILLGRRSRQQDFVLGASEAKDPSRLMAVRVRLQDKANAAELLTQINGSLAMGSAHRGLPYTQVVEALQFQKSLSYHPLFQVMVALHAAPQEGAAASAVVATDQFDLALQLQDAGELIEGTLDYATDLFEHSTVEHMASQFLTALESIAADDRQCIEELNLLSSEEREQVVSRWNKTTERFPAGTLPELLTAQVARTPAADAVAEGLRTLSYSALAAQSDSIAALLQSFGIGVGAVVGIALPRGIESVIAAFGVLKAGAICLPLDLALPDQRLAFMLRDVRCALVLTDKAAAARLPRDLIQWRFGDALPVSAPAAMAFSPDQAASIIFEPSPTGTPHGIAISHSSLVNLAFARNCGHDPIGPGDRVLASASVGVDVSIGQLLPPLLSGACVVVAPELRTLSVDAFWELLAEQRVTHLESVPSLIEHLLDSAGRQPNLVLKRLILGGEPLTSALAARLHAALPQTTLVNVYGCPEAGIEAAAYIVPEDLEAEPSTLPIGRLLANCCGFVLDERMQPLPPGVAGELYLGGRGLTTGYLNRPVETATHFVANPFGAPGTRLFQTGDRAMWRTDGTLQWFGRADRRIIIRGNPVEPEETAAALLSHPDVAQAAVLVRIQEGPPQLVAFVVGHVATPNPSQRSLRDHVGSWLPAHAIPSTIAVLDSFPLTPTGEVDAEALLALPGVPGMESIHDAPLNEAEFRLARIWQELLGRPSVGRNENFFDLGGHSLLAFQLAARIKAEFGRAVSMTRLMQAPTVAQLALDLDEVRVRSSPKHSAAFNANGRRSPMFCITGSDAELDIYDCMVRLIDGSVPVYNLAASSGATAPAATRARGHERVLRRIQRNGPYRICGVRLGGSEAFELACLLEQAGEEVLLLLLDAQASPQWSAGSGWVPRLLRKLRIAEDDPMESPQFHGRVVLFEGGADESAGAAPLDGRRGWRRFARGRLDVIHMEVDRTALLNEPAAGLVARHINELLCA
jgi:amino acid adenylation domain-containing protein